MNGSAISNTIRRFGITIVATRPRRLVTQTGAGMLPTTSSSEKSAKKYQAGYGTNCVLFGSAFASSGAGEKTASAKTITNIAKETTVSMNIWSGQKRPGLSFGRSSCGGPAEPFQRK